MFAVELACRCRCRCRVLLLKSCLHLRNLGAAAGYRCQGAECSVRYEAWAGCEMFMAAWAWGPDRDCVYAVAKKPSGWVPLKQCWCNMFRFFSLNLNVGLSVYLTVSLSFYLSVYLFIYLPIYLSTYLSIYLSFFLSYLSIYLCIYLFIYLSVCLSVYLCIHPHFFSIWKEVSMGDFHQKWKLTCPKRAKSARRRQKVKAHSFETKNFCKTSSILNLKTSKTNNSARFLSKIESF